MSTDHGAGDLRVRRTHAALRAALLDLLAAKPLDQVTVRELTARAMVNRATFYRHYRDKEHLATSIFEDAVAQLSDRMQPSRDLSGIDPATPPEAWVDLHRHIRDHAPLYRALLRSRPWFADVVSRTVMRHVHERIAAAGGPSIDPLLPADLGLTMIANAWVGAVEWWLRDGEGAAPEDLARAFLGFATHGYLRAMGFPAAEPRGRPRG